MDQAETGSVNTTKEYERAAELIKNAKGILIGTGAGMGVSSGLGTFRGKNAGVWPPLAKLGIDFTEMSNPVWFAEGKDSAFGYAFWHFRYTAYSGADAHEGYTLLKKLCEQKEFGGFSFTSNIDGHWLKCGFPEDKIAEVHGSVHWMQCSGAACGDEDPVKTDPLIYSQMVLTESEDGKIRVTSPLPRCTKCDSLIRPNVLMFGDYGWNPERWTVQANNFKNWIQKWAVHAETVDSEALGKETFLVIEIGAGKAVPTVRMQCESVVQVMGKLGYNVAMIRINPVDSDFSDSFKSKASKYKNSQLISLEDDALPALQKLTQII